MNATADCIACIFKQALNTARIASSDPRIQEAVLRRLAADLPDNPLNQSPAAFSQAVYRIVGEVTGVRDPYASLKQEMNLHALALLPSLEAAVTTAEDPLKTALHLAVAGNIIDLGIGHAFDLSRDIRRLLTHPFAADDYADFLDELIPGRRCLYLSDNCGEIVFDRILVEQLLHRGLQVTVAVKSGPIINDATREDALTAGFGPLCPILETGSDDIGVNWTRTSAGFRQACAEVDFLIAKGHGNFETCVDRPENFYFLLMAKCPVVAATLHVNVGDTVFRHRAHPGS